MPSGDEIAILASAGWSSSVARQAHNLKAAGSNPAPAPNFFSFSPLFIALFLNPGFGKLGLGVVSSFAFGDDERKQSPAQTGQTQARILPVRG